VAAGARRLVQPPGDEPGRVLVVRGDDDLDVARAQI